MLCQLFKTQVKEFLIKNAEKHKRTKIALSKRQFDSREVLTLGSCLLFVYQIRLRDSGENWCHSFDIIALSYYMISFNLSLLVFQYPRTCRVPYVFNICLFSLHLPKNLSKFQCADARGRVGQADLFILLMFIVQSTTQGHLRTFTNTVGQADKKEKKRQRAENGSQGKKCGFV